MQSGDRFGPYVLEERLAAGGMAEVFRARRVGAAGFARAVCIKRMLPSLCTDAHFVQMFIDEARMGAQLRHGNIVAIDDFGEVDGQFYLCMELVSGADLSRLSRVLQQRGQRVPIEVGAFVLHEVLRALDYAHRKVGADGQPLQLIHRDVSPQNVLVSFAGEVKLTDFGIARARARLTQTAGQVVKGKLAYMSPEQARGVAMDHRTDLFALGVVLFELLAGRRPFQGATEAAQVLALLRGDRPRLRELRPDVDPALEALVDKLLALEPAQRPPDAAAALAEASVLPGTLAGGRRLQALMTECFPGASSSARQPVVAPPVASVAPVQAPRVEPSLPRPSPASISGPALELDATETPKPPGALPATRQGSVPSPVRSAFTDAATAVSPAASVYELTPAPPVPVGAEEPHDTVVHAQPPAMLFTLEYDAPPGELAGLGQAGVQREHLASSVTQVTPTPEHWMAPPVGSEPVEAPAPIAPSVPPEQPPAPPEPLQPTRERTAVETLPVEEPEHSRTERTRTMARPAEAAPKPVAPSPAGAAQKPVSMLLVVAVLLGLGLLSAAVVYVLLPTRSAPASQPR